MLCMTLNGNVCLAAYSMHPAAAQHLRGQHSPICQQLLCKPYYIICVHTVHALSTSISDCRVQITWCHDFATSPGHVYCIVVLCYMSMQRLAARSTY